MSLYIIGEDGSIGEEKIIQEIEQGPGIEFSPVIQKIQGEDPSIHALTVHRILKERNTEKSKYPGTEREHFQKRRE